MENCIKCNTKIANNFCPNCGQPKKVERINGKYILKEFGSILNFEKGILFTIKGLITKPGENIKAFIGQDRNRLVKPILFLILTSLIYSIINQIFKIEDSYVQVSGLKENSVTKLFGWVQANYGYANIIMGVFISLWLKIFFKKYNYNFFEILILMCFTMGIGMLIFSVFSVFEAVTKFKINQFGGIMAIIYNTWSIGQFFDKKRKTNYIKAFFAYFIGMISFAIVLVLIGVLVDLI